MIIILKILFSPKTCAKAQPLKKIIYGMIFLAKYEIRFQRQKAIDHFIADFYCHKAKLIIEIDGSQHHTATGMQKDLFRTEILEGYDLKIIRFTNRQIDTAFATVCEYIDSIVKESHQKQ